MPRKKLLRRFEPRYGVSEPMLEAEAVWAGREFKDYLRSDPSRITGRPLKDDEPIPVVPFNELLFACQFALAGHLNVFRNPPPHFSLTRKIGLVHKLRGYKH